MAVGEPAEAPSEPRRRRRTPARARRRDREATRAELLGAGLELVAERPVGSALGHLRINDLAAAHGLTSGAFYHYWDGQDAYRAEILDALLAEDRLDARPGLCSGTGLDPGAADGAAVVTAAATTTIGRATADPHHRLQVGLWAEDDPEVRPVLARRVHRADRRWAHRLAVLLDGRGRAPVPPWDIERLGGALGALLDGLLTQYDVDHRILAGRPGPSGPWAPAPALALAVLLGATEPGTPPPAPPVPESAPDPADPSPEGRRRLVDLGVAAALAQPVGPALDHIRAQDVVARRGLTIGAFYHYWESQDDYRDDLLDALLAADRYVDRGQIRGQRDAILGATSLDDAVRGGTSWYWAEAANHPNNRYVLGFTAIDDPFISPRLAAHEDDLRAAWRPPLEAALERFDRRLRPPLDVEAVVIGMAATLEGLILRQGLGFDGLGPDDEGWTRWGHTCHALLLGATAPAGDDRLLHEVATEALRKP